jgi:hypothetical protein
MYENGDSGIRGERKCKVCGKIFFTTPEWVYKANINRHRTDVCSYTCMKTAKAGYKDGRTKTKTEKLADKFNAMIGEEA